MILRIYKTSVSKELHAEFEEKFRAVAAELLTTYDGLIAVEIARPSQWKPLEFIMISKWDTVEAIQKMAGPNWNEVYIPEHMKKYMLDCSLDHYYTIDPNT